MEGTPILCASPSLQITYVEPFDRPPARTCHTSVTCVQRSMWVIQRLCFSGWPLPSFLHLVHHCSLSSHFWNSDFFWRAFLAFQFRNSLINRSLLCQYLIIFFSFVIYSFIQASIQYPKYQELSSALAGHTQLLPSDTRNWRNGCENR